MKKLLLSTVLAALFATSSLAGMGGDILRTTLVVENLEYQFNDEKALTWDAYGFVGYDINKVYVYTEGEKIDGESLASESQIVYSRAISSYWDMQVGVEYDKIETEKQTWLIAGVQGLAPYFFETRAVLLFGKDGTLGVKAHSEYEALITQKLILTPSIALSAYTQDIPEMGIGSGLSNINVGVRLRYEFIREFAPYVGVEWSKNFGNTEDLVELNETYAVGGLRFWF